MPTKRKCCSKSKVQKLIEKETDLAVKEAKVVGKKIAVKFKQAKEKFDALDPVRKKQILAGIIGATAVAVGVGARIAAKSKKKN